MASIFLTHGAGPLPLIQPKQHQLMHQQLHHIAQTYKSPKAIIIFSAHWEEQHWTILDHDTPPLYFDYTNFPPETYQLSYNIKSSSQLRQIVKNHLIGEGIQLKSQSKRGYDHGVFIPLMLMYPFAQIPVIQISILASLNPEQHFKMGLKMKGLIQQGFLVIGSGASVHGNFRQPSTIKKSEAFLRSIKQIYENPSEEERLSKIKNWKSIEFGEWCHPRQQHLIPLFISIGALGQSQFKEMIWFSEGMGMFLSNYILK